MCCFLTILLVFDEFADKHSAVPNFSLVNEPDLTKILKVEIFVHIDRQLKAAHLILGYNPFSTSFQAPKCLIKAADPRLQRISVAHKRFGFIVPEGVPIPDVTPFSQPSPVAATSVGASSSRPVI